MIKQYFWLLALFLFLVPSPGIPAGLLVIYSKDIARAYREIFTTASIRKNTNQGTNITETEKMFGFPDGPREGTR